MPELRQQFEKRVRVWESFWQSRTTLPQRMTAVVLLSVSCGVLVADLASAGPWGAVWEVVMLVAAAAINLAWALRSVVTPVQRLARHLHELAEEARPEQLRQLPTRRADLLGEIARSARHLCLVSMRRHIEHRTLRKELDQRVEQQTRKATAKLRKLAMRDPLTNLGNRRFLDRSLKRLVTRCVEQRQHLACLAMDLDGFKQVNDTLGHAAGDGLLVAMGQTLRRLTRETDFAARPGGDEFIVLLVGADRAAAMAKAETVRHAFGQATVSRLAGTGLTTGVSIGVASLDDDECASAEMLLDVADRRLYDDKHHRKQQADASRLVA